MDDHKYDFALKEIVKLVGEVGVLRGRLDAHLHLDHNYDLSRMQAYDKQVEQPAPSDKGEGEK